MPYSALRDSPSGRISSTQAMRLRRRRHRRGAPRKATRACQPGIPPEHAHLNHRHTSLPRVAAGEPAAKRPGYAPLEVRRLPARPQADSAGIPQRLPPHALRRTAFRKASPSGYGTPHALPSKLPSPWYRTHHPKAFLLYRQVLPFGLHSSALR